MTAIATLLTKLSPLGLETVARDAIASMECHRQGVLVACSGGADSVLLAHLAAASSVPVRIAYVNHHLESQTHDWEARVRALAAHLDCPVVVSHLDGPALVNDPNGMEAAARRARYQALGRWRRPSETIVTGHTASDRFETMMIRLLQGCGNRALAGPLPTTTIHGHPIARPLLGWTREQVRRAVEHLGWHATQDPSNDDPSHLRARVRPIVSALSNVVQGEAWVQSMRHVASDVQAAETMAQQLVERLTQVSPNAAIIDRRRFVELAEELQAIVAHRVLSRAGIRPDAALIDRLIAVSVSGEEAWGHGVRIGVWEDRVVIQRTESGRAPLSVTFPDTLVQVGRWPTPLGVLQVSPWRGQIARETHRATVDLDQLVGAVSLRCATGEETMHAEGRHRRGALQALAKKDGWSALHRRHIVVVSDEQGPVWIVGGRVAQRALVSASTQRAWTLTWSTALSA